MSSIALSGNASGAGVFTIASPNSASSYTLTLPTTTGTLIAGVATEAQGGTGTTTGYYGFKNRIINGAMVIAQRATSSATQGYSTVDRFYVNRTGSVAGISMAQVYAAFSTTTYSLSTQRDAGNTSTAALNIYQAIEGKNCLDLSGQSVTLSFQVGTGANVTTTGHTMTVAYQTTTTDIGPTSGGWTQLTPVAFTVIANSSFQSKSATFSIPSTATQLMIIISYAVTGTAGADDRFYTTNVQLEKGSTATSFDYRPYGTELALCQRYYQRNFNPAGGGYITNSNSFVAFCKCVVTMRATPTISQISGSTVSYDLFGVAGGTIASPSTGSATVNGFRIWGAGTLAATFGNPGHLDSDCVQASAEL